MARPLNFKFYSVVTEFHRNSHRWRCLARALSPLACGALNRYVRGATSWKPGRETQKKLNSPGAPGYMQSRVSFLFAAPATDGQQPYERSQEEPPRWTQSTPRTVKDNANYGGCSKRLSFGVICYAAIGNRRGGEKHKERSARLSRDPAVSTAPSFGRIWPPAWCDK